MLLLFATIESWRDDCGLHAMYAIYCHVSERFLWILVIIGGFIGLVEV